MKDVQLTALGVSLWRELQAVIMGHAVGWCDSYYLTDDDLQNFRAMKTDVEQLICTGFNFAELEESLTTGFFPEALAVPGSEAEVLRSSVSSAVNIGDNELQTSGTVPRTSRLFSQRSAKWENYSEHDPYLTEEDLQDISSVRNDVEQSMRTGFDFTELEESLTAGFFPAKTPVPEEEDGQGDGFPSWEGLGVGHSLLEGDQGGVNDQNYPRLPEEKPFSLWKQEQHTSIKGLKEFIRVLESEQQKENHIISEADSPSYAENRERIFGQSTQAPRNYRERGIVSEPEEQGLKRVLETELSANSERDLLLPMLEKVPLNAQKPEVQGEFLRGDDVAELDIDQIMEALTEEIYREYIRFYGK